MAEILTVSLAANEQKQFRKAGSYFEIIDSSFAVSVNLYSDLGSQINSINSIISGFFLNAKFGAFDIKNSAIAQIVQILVLDQGETGGSRRAPGIVSVVDGERIKVLSGVCFRGAGVQAGAGVQQPAVQLWNPVGSGKNFFVSNVRLGGSVNDTWYLFTTTTPAPTNQGTAGNLDRTQPNSTGQIRRGNDATSYAATVSAALGFFSPNIDLVVPFLKPLLVRPGYGFQMQSQTVTPTVNTVFEWEEWPI